MMLTKHLKHTFIKSSFNPEVSYCSECGSLKHRDSYTIKPPQFFNKNDTDPLAIFASHNNKLSNTKFDLSNEIFKLKNLRDSIISIIKYVSNKYELDEKVFHSSIYLMDYLRLELNYMDDFKVTTLVCIIMVTKFMGDGEKGRIMERDLFIARKDSSYPKREETILKLIGYNLSFVTAYDIMTVLLFNGIVFNEDANLGCIEKIYLNCLLQLNCFVEKHIFLNYTPIQIVFAIIAFNRELYGLSNQNFLFEKIYSISESLYIDCLKMLKTKIKIQKCRIPHSSSNHNKKGIRE